MKRTLSIACALAVCAFSQQAWAVAFWDIDTKSTFTLVSDGGLIITSESHPPTAFTTDVEIGTGTNSGIAVPTPSDFPIVSTIMTTGSASAPPTSASELIWMGGNFVRLTNTTEGLLTATFTHLAEWDLTATRTLPASEFAEAGAFFHITDADDTESFLVDGVLASEYLLNPTISTILGDATEIDSALVSITVIVGPGEHAFSVIHDSRGFAGARQTAVPEPASASLVVLAGLALLQSASRRKP